MVDDIIMEVISDLVMLLSMIILVFYLTYRDSKRQDIIDARYDKLIGNMIDNISRQQSAYKEEMVSEVKELTIATSHVLTGVERVASGVKDVQLEVIKVIESVKDVSFGVERVVNEVDRVTNNIKDVSTGVANVYTGVEQVANEVTRVTDGVKEVSSGVTEVVSSLQNITNRIDQELKRDINDNK